MYSSALAAHEAGHATAAIVLGGEVVRTWIDGDWGWTHFKKAKLYEPIVVAAGNAGEIVLLGHSRSDTENPTKEELDAACRLLRENFPLLRRVYHRLMLNGEISSEEVSRLFARYGAEGRGGIRSRVGRADARRRPSRPLSRLITSPQGAGRGPEDRNPLSRVGFLEVGTEVR